MDYHLHAFKVLNPKTKKIDCIGRTFHESSKKGLIDGQTVNMTNYFVKPGDKAEYFYDFGDRWEHNVVLEKIYPAVKNTCYPVCINGKRACPPEDCGGYDGYNELLKIIRNSKHPEYAAKWKWLTQVHNYSNFNPDTFDPADVHFHPSEVKPLLGSNKAEETFYDCIPM